MNNLVDMRKLFVGNLKYETTDAGLRQYFHSFGDIVEAVVKLNPLDGRPTGYGFVTMVDAQAADRALSFCRHPLINGRRANVSIAGCQSCARWRAPPASPPVVSRRTSTAMTGGDVCGAAPIGTDAVSQPEGWIPRLADDQQAAAAADYYAAAPMATYALPQPFGVSWVSGGNGGFYMPLAQPQPTLGVPPLLYQPQQSTYVPVVSSQPPRVQLYYPQLTIQNVWYCQLYDHNYQNVGSFQ